MTTTRPTAWEQLMVAVTAGALSVMCLMAIHGLGSYRLESRGSDVITFRMPPERSNQRHSDTVQRASAHANGDDVSAAQAATQDAPTPQSTTSQPEEVEPLDNASHVPSPVSHSAASGASASWWSNFSAVRIMFVGDSISEGLAAGSTARFVPKNGSCSFRFHLIRRVSDSIGLRAKPVGPFTASFGGRTPESCCAAAISTRASAAASPPPSRATAPNCMQAFGVHASIWGVRLESLLNSTSAQLLQHRLGLYRKYFRKHTSSSHSVMPEGPLALRQVGTPLQRWASAYKPHVVLLFAGTNDYSNGVTAASIVGRLMPKAMEQILRKSKSTIRRIAVCTVLPRKAFDVSELNDNLLAIRTCRQTNARSSNPGGCISCIEPLIQGTNATMSWKLWCDARVRILHCGDSQRITNATEFLYDGLHPNWNGEEVLANIIHSEMLAEGVV